MNLRKPLPLLAAVLVVGVGAPAALATADLNGGAHGDTTTQGELGTAEHGQSGVNEADGQNNDIATQVETGNVDEGQVGTPGEATSTAPGIK